MSSEELGLASSHNGLGSHSHSQLVFQDETLRFGAPPQRRVGDTGPKTRELSGFIDDRFFPPQNPDFRRSMYGENPERPEPRGGWNPNGAVRTPSTESSDEDDDDDDVDNDDDGGVAGLFGEERRKGSGGNNASIGEDKMGNGNVKHHHLQQQQHQQQQHSSFGGSLLLGSGGAVLEKDHSVGLSSNSTRASPSNNNHDQLPGRLGVLAATVAESDGDVYYSQYLQGSEGSGTAQKDLVVENGCGFSGRKEALCSSESGDSLRRILSDPVTGALMDDAVILPCGHSFGGGGVQQVIRMKACFTCSQSISEDSIAPNLSLRAAVQAFRREEELQYYHSSKRKRDKSDQDKGVYGDLGLLDPPRGKGVQFPFSVTDRVFIKGNKRTPERFVGREAVVTTQCLNGWYVVKTVDNAESVKLQYRSLAKVPDDLAKPLPSKTVPNWL